MQTSQAFIDPSHFHLPNSDEVLPKSNHLNSTLLHPDIETSHLYLSEEHARGLMNEYGAVGQAFLFVIDFQKEHCLVHKPDEIKSGPIQYNINGVSNAGQNQGDYHLPVFESYPISYEEYYDSFSRAKKQLQEGNSYLVNLTVETPIHTGGNLRSLYDFAKARYKLMLEDQFLVFSPETFVRIKNGRISSYPMKGTIDATISQAAEKIIGNLKEQAEHATIVDLIRNDLAMVSQNVRVERYRYLDTIFTQKKPLLQVSSEICGDLTSDFPSHLGDIIFTLLPAGSITGAPKKKTVDIISQIETHRRGFYTGICGYFDGQNLDSGVMIRFIEQRNGRFYYKSGGGITNFSNPCDEYQEYIDKIYVPIV